MRCTKQEALMILSRWFKERSPLLLNFVAAPATDGLRLRGRIALLEPDSLLFASRTASVQVRFDQATFEHEEEFLLGPDSRRELSGSVSCISLHLSVCQSHQMLNDAPQTQLSLTEAL
jgi:hypothetical protein